MKCTFEFQSIYSCSAGTAYRSGVHEFTLVLSGFGVPSSFVFCVMLCRSLIVLLPLAIVLSVLRFMASDYLFGIFKLFLYPYSILWSIACFFSLVYRCLFFFLLVIVLSVLRLMVSDYFLVSSSVFIHTYLALETHHKCLGFQVHTRGEGLQWYNRKIFLCFATRRLNVTFICACILFSNIPLVL